MVRAFNFLAVLGRHIGGLDDLAWTTAARLATFVKQQPLEAEPASEDTTVCSRFSRRHG